MTDEDVRHEIVRFGREDIADLRAMPSASGQAEMHAANRAPQKLARFCCVLGGLAVVFLCLAWLAVYLIGNSAPVSRLLHARVEQAVRQAMGSTAALELGPARLNIDGANALAVGLTDFSLTDGPDAPKLHANELTVGIQIIPLLRGRVELANARIANARIELGKGGSQPGWLAAVSGEDGLIDPDKLAPAVFGSVQQLVELMRRSNGGALRLEDVTVISAGQEITVRELDLTGSDADISLAGVVGFGGAEYELNGETQSEQGQIAGFNLTLSQSGIEGGSVVPTAALSGDRSAQTGKATIRLGLTRAGNEIDLGPRRGILSSDLDLALRATEGEAKVEIEKLDLLSGQNQFRFTGAIAGNQSATDTPAYRFELVSNDSLIAPEGSTEARMPAAIRLGGTYVPDWKQLDLSELQLRASSGEVVGAAQLTFAPGISPAIKLDLSVGNMEVAQVKQLWPWLAADKARQWVMENFFGGKVLRGTVSYDIAAGRLQDRTPLNPQEVSGEFEIAGSRFDTTGVLPAIREANGAVRFAGERVEIELASGYSYAADGQRIDISNGKMVIADTRIRPVIARLEMDFGGDARSVAEVASREPLNALRGIEFTPDDLSGSVRGHVSSDVPLQKGVDPKTLDWNVSLDYRDVAIAKPIQGQKVDQAQGTLHLQPDRAVIVAKGRLNGIPAEFDLVQPIRGSAVPVKRDVVLTLGDRERATLAPALNTIMSGPARVSLDASKPGKRQITADLTGTRLELPWAGWSKGPGIAATAKLELLANGQVRNLQIDGKSFSARGSIDMAGGNLRVARFDTLSLNPGDDIALEVARDGNTYTVTVSGEVFDSRAFIKQLYDQGGAASGRTTVVVNADVGSLIGFNGETLRNAKVRYRGNSAGGGSASVSGIVGRNAPFSMDDERANGSRRVSASTGDAGALLRLLNVYTRLQGGNLQLSMAGSDRLRGQVEVRNFQIVNEPRLNSLVSTSPSGQNGSLNDATRSRIDTSRVQFDRAFAQLDKAPKSLRVANAVLRGPVIGTTFEGVVYDADNRMDLSGTFLPAYGLNSIFGDIPLLGAFLGGGPDGGLIGVTYRLRGDMRSPRVEVNPLSAVAPGIFRKIFEY